MARGAGGRCGRSAGAVRSVTVGAATRNVVVEGTGLRLVATLTLGAGQARSAVAVVAAGAILMPWGSRLLLFAMARLARRLLRAGVGFVTLVAGRVPRVHGEQLLAVAISAGAAWVLARVNVGCVARGALSMSRGGRGQGALGGMATCAQRRVRFLIAEVVRPVAGGTAQAFRVRDAVVHALLVAVTARQDAARCQVVARRGVRDVARGTLPEAWHTWMVVLELLVTTLTGNTRIGLRCVSIVAVAAGGVGRDSGGGQRRRKIVTAATIRARLLTEIVGLVAVCTRLMAAGEQRLVRDSWRSGGMARHAGRFGRGFGGVHLLVACHARVLHAGQWCAVTGVDILVAVGARARLGNVRAVRRVTARAIREAMRLERLLGAGAQAVALGTMPCLRAGRRARIGT